jgi:hypothetical protein
MIWEGDAASATNCCVVVRVFLLTSDALAESFEGDGMTVERSFAERIVSLLPIAALTLFMSFANLNQAVAQASSRAAPVFLKAFYPLDEPRFHCVDIPGHKARVDVGRSLSVHTCKEGIWHKDELFDRAALRQGHLKMPEYGLCIEAGDARDGAPLSLKACGRSALQIWQYENYRLVLKAHPDKCLTIGPEPSRLTPGGRRLPSKHRARSLALAACSKAAFERQLWRLEAPQHRTGPVLPFQK